MSSGRSLEAILTDIETSSEVSLLKNTCAEFKKAIFPAEKNRDRHKISDNLILFCQKLGELCRNDNAAIANQALLELTEFDAWYINYKSNARDFVKQRTSSTSATRFRTVVYDKKQKKLRNVYTTRSDNAVTVALKKALRIARKTTDYQNNKNNLAYIAEDIIARRRHNRAWQFTKKIPVIAVHFAMAFAFPINLFAAGMKAATPFITKAWSYLATKIGFTSAGALGTLGMAARIKSTRLRWKARFQRWFGKNQNYSLAARMEKLDSPMSPGSAKAASRSTQGQTLSMAVKVAKMQQHPSSHAGLRSGQAMSPSDDGTFNACTTCRRAIATSHQTPHICPHCELNA